MANDDKIELDGVVTDALKGMKFKVKLDDNNMEVLCSVSGKMRMNNIRNLEGDKVTVQISPYD